MHSIIFILQTLFSCILKQKKILQMGKLRGVQRLVRKLQYNYGKFCCLSGLFSVAGLSFNPSDPDPERGRELLSEGMFAQRYMYITILVVVGFILLMRCVILLSLIGGGGQFTFFFYFLEK